MRINAGIEGVSAGAGAEFGESDAEGVAELERLEEPDVKLDELDLRLEAVSGTEPFGLGAAGAVLGAGDCVGGIFFADVCLFSPASLVSNEVVTADTIAAPMRKFRTFRELRIEWCALTRMVMLLCVYLDKPLWRKFHFLHSGRNLRPAPPNKKTGLFSCPFYFWHFQIKY
jgi:hypothetical protein